jgi:hypothetical protein
MKLGHNGNLSLGETFMVPRTLCKKHYETTFSEEKLSNAEKESQDKTLMKNVIHVFL